MPLIDETATVKDAVYVASRPMLTQKEGANWLRSAPKGEGGSFHLEFTECAEHRRRVLVLTTRGSARSASTGGREGKQGWFDHVVPGGRAFAGGGAASACGGVEEVAYLRY